MQELILVVSRCISRKKSVEGKEYFFKFHFRGFYAGEKIKLIHLYSSRTEELSKGEDYLLWVKRKRVYQAILEVDLIKAKKIS